MLPHKKIRMRIQGRCNEIIMLRVCWPKMGGPWRWMGICVGVYVCVYVYYGEDLEHICQ